MCNFDWLNFKSNKTLRHEDWHNERVLYLNIGEINILDCVTRKGIINASDIVGIARDDYCKYHPLSWLNLLNNLRRFRRYEADKRNIDRDNIIALIHSTDVFPTDSKQVFEIENQYYILSGMHRLTIAKFFNVKDIELEIIHIPLTKNGLLDKKILRYSNEEDALF